MIKNLTKNKIISNNVKYCNNILSRGIGLMFSKKSNKSLIFNFKNEKIIPLHMLFVFYPIDVLYLNANKKIVEIKENLKPFLFYTPRNKATYVIELPQNAVKNYKISLNDKLEFPNNNL